VRHERADFVEGPEEAFVRRYRTASCHACSPGLPLQKDGTEARIVLRSDDGAARFRGVFGRSSYRAQPKMTGMTDRERPATFMSV
jgi:hypothetical protein